MAMSVGSPDDDEGEVVSAINTTPLVDVMLVLLIIFLITIPVVTHTIHVQLPLETNKPLQTKPQNIIIAVTKDGDYYWDQQKVADIAALKDKLKSIANVVPQPEVHIRGDATGPYEYVGRVVVALQQSGIFKFALILQPPAKG
jgi:biopolymer transport protein ExbD